MPKKRRRSPLLGVAFNTRRMDEEDVLRAYISELEHYRPRGFSRLVREGHGMVRAYEDCDLHLVDRYQDWQADAAEILTNWARRAARHDYISFRACGDDVGFHIDIDQARDDADLRLADGDYVPRGFSGLAFFVNDHGNVSARTFARGRRTRELFAVV